MNIREFKQYALNRLGTSAERPEIRFLVTALLEELAGVPRYGYHTMEDRVLNPAIEKHLPAPLIRLPWETPAVHSGFCPVCRVPYQGR